jgi:hypothetical protein
VPRGRAARAVVVAAALLGAALTGCAGAGAARPAGRETAPNVQEWRWARQRLAEARGKSDGKPRTMRIALTLREPVTGRALQARGAVAVAPPSALRMILLGPGGTTALDLWSRDDRFRFEVPAIDLLRRGDARTPRTSMRGLPVDFLRWWLLRPLAGRLLWHRREPTGDRFVLRDGESLVRAWVGDDGRIEARRSAAGGLGGALDEERVSADRAGCATVRYQQRSTGLDVVVRCEGEEGKAPEARAFQDPDAEGKR